RPGRVRGDHLDLNVLRAPGRATAVVTAGLEDLAERVAEPCVRDPDVDEAGACDLGARDLRQRDRGIRELLRELARRAAPLGSEPQRGVRRVVAVLRVVGPLEL